ncbi:MAG: hypothetical protein ACKOCF_01330 [Gammaproteobacteria bacterium]
MDLEDLIVGIVAGVALLWQAVVWLKEQLDTPQKLPTPVTEPRAGSESEPEFVGLGTRFVESIEHARQAAPGASALSTAAERGRSLRQQLGLDQRNALQRSIILMTVLGPCRASERGTGNHIP